MCGIYGIISEKEVSENKIISIGESLIHRGPDYGNYKRFSIGSKKIVIGHRRLSIIDLTSNGNQPMEFENIIISYNGEVYNYKEIKDELMVIGYKFETNSDTEVIIYSYLEWGVKCVDRFIGMFAFTIIDKKKRKAFLFRDRAGVKPLYYYFKNNDFAFSSELKPIISLFKLDKTSIKIDAVADFFKKAWIPAPYTIFNDVFKVKPGHYIEYCLETNDIKCKKYWDINDYYNEEKYNFSYEEAMKKTEELLKSSCEYRMISDTPVGVFLSGGYDSSLVAAILQKTRKKKIQTFSIGFEDKEFDESPYAREVAKLIGTEHHELICSENDAFKLISKLPYHYDEPFGDSSAIPTMLVSKLASEHVKVALSADGGDEIFGGYTRYYDNLKELNNVIKIKKIPFLGNLILKTYSDYLNKGASLEKIRSEKLKICSKLPLKSKEIYRTRIEPRHFSDTELRSLIKDDFKINKNYYSESAIISHLDPLSYMKATEYKTTMVDDILVKVDRASMAFSIESREPLIDHRLSEFAARLPESFLYSENYPKRILRDICHKYISKELMDRPKKGFAIPTEKWMKGIFRPKLEFYSSKKFIVEQGIFNHKEINIFLETYFQNKDNNHERAWIFLMFQMWWDEWIC